MQKITRFIAYLADRVVRERPRCPKIVRDAVWLCHQASAGRVKSAEWSLQASQTIQEAYPAPHWQFVAQVLAVAYWTVCGNAEDETCASGRMVQKERFGYARIAASYAFELAQELGVNGYDLAELYLCMNYGADIAPDRRDAALAALVAGYADVADDIVSRT